MLFEAFFWNPASPRPAFAEFRDDPQAVRLLADWGREGDHLVIAEVGETPVGAAWYRLWTDENHSYGFVSADVPELGLAVTSSFRSQGIGRALLHALIRNAREEHFSAMSLSVSPRNPARRLYETTGFRKIGESGTSWTYLLALDSVE
jgi:ribosomal protein S18 acetylase RimI-like enzyme